MFGEVLIILIHSGMRALQQFHDFQHGTAWNDIELPPDIQGFLRYPFDKRNFAFCHMENPFHLRADISRDRIDFAPLGFDTQRLGDIIQFVGVFDCIIFDFSAQHPFEQIQHVSSVT